jgi:ParB family chromosome partitioning protein
MRERKKLGKGLGALLSSDSAQNMSSLLNNGKVSEENAIANDREELKHIPVDLIQRGKYQPRVEMDEVALEELALSIKAQGVMQPIVIRSIAPQKYEIIAGERRWRAAQMAGLDSIPAVIKSVSDEAAIAMSLIENIQRENLNPIEEALALKRLQDEFQLTQQEVANAVGRSRTTVTNLIRLVGLHIDVQKMLQSGKLEMGHARALLTLPDSKQVEFARVVAQKGLSVRQTEALVRKVNLDDEPKLGRNTDPNIKKLEESLGEKLGARVLVQHNSKGKGRLIITYNSLDELDGILAHLD